ncbi:hypothetical protein ACFQV2_10440 [Actinokineospora soli]|uniref:Uncharacterized protein n=1 Tax=Actinokineospora soli TaxID=1048753 RepID=A0ABW2TL67_9PSEU
MEPWGMSGPEFLRIYLVGFVFVLLFAAAVRIAVRAGTPVGRSVAGMVTADRLSVHELAYLAGGRGGWWRPPWHGCSTWASSGRAATGRSGWWRGPRRRTRSTGRS